jgi:hypothetical protein
LCVASISGRDTLGVACLDALAIETGAANRPTLNRSRYSTAGKRLGRLGFAALL